MYFDYIKKSYDNIPDTQIEQYIERDKKALGVAIKEKIAKDIDDIVERWYNIDDIGAYSEQEDFFVLLQEAEYLYSYGFYIGAIASIGIACEECCKFLIEKNNNIIPNEKQYNRLKRLLEKGIITESVYKNFDYIREIRNNFVHYDKNAKSLKGEPLSKQTLEVINKYKSSISQIFEKTDFKPENMSLNSSIGFKEFEIKHKNYLYSKGFDLQLPTNISYKSFSSIYKVMEVDIHGENFKEFTLFDIYENLLVIVDLTIPQAKHIENIRLQENNLIVATILSKVDVTGSTNEYHLLEIEDIFFQKNL